jgi:hypothetical protein
MARSAVNATCNICGAGFVPRRGKPNKYCSPQCRRVGIRKLVTCICESCGKPHQRRPSEVRRFCSSKCSGAHMSEQARLRREAAPPKVERICTCLHCGKSFTPVSKSSKGKFCSSRCVGLSKRIADARRDSQGAAIKSRPSKCCEACGAEFSPNHDAQRFCSNDCARIKVDINRTCECCGAVKRKGDGVYDRDTKKFFCSDSCMNLHTEMRSIDEVLHEANMLVRESRNAWRVSVGRPDRRAHCLHCGQPFVARADSKGKFCGNTCAGLYNRKVTINA